MQFIDVRYAFHKQKLFDGLDLTFEMGKIIGLVGMNGSGKSTLLRIICGLCEPDKGKVLFQQRDLYRDRSLQSSIGYVPSTPMLYPFLTVKENLQWIKTSYKLNQHRYYDVVAKFELKDYEQVLFEKLSDGLKKRVCLASQFLHLPNLLVLDEPCATLDPLQRQHLWQTLQDYRAASRLIIISSHHPEEIATFCDEIVLLSQGKLLNYPHSSNFAKTLWDTIQHSAVPEEEAIL